jgi:hypothetical protein
MVKNTISVYPVIVKNTISVRLDIVKNTMILITIHIEQTICIRKQ